MLTEDVDCESLYVTECDSTVNKSPQNEDQGAFGMVGNMRERTTEACNCAVHPDYIINMLM